MIDASEALRKAVLGLAGATGLAPLAKPFLGGVGAILMLHSVTTRPERPDGFNAHLTVTPQFLDDLVGAMKADGYAFVSMDDVAERLRTGAGQGRFAALTADDGYRDNLVEALPVLEKHGAPICIHIAPALIDGSVALWWEVLDEIVATGRPVELATPGGRVRLECDTPAQRAATFRRLLDHVTTDVGEADQQKVVGELAASVGLQKGSRPGRLLDWDELRRLAAHPLVTIGAHTIHHANLARLDETDARAELIGAADILEQRLGRRPCHMAYPYGYPTAVGQREVALAREAGFVTAVTTRHGLLQPAHAGHMQALPRISLNGRYQRLGHVRTMLSGITTPLANSGKVFVTV